jgi:hypothetical protein
MVKCPSDFERAYMNGPETQRNIRKAIAVLGMARELFFTEKKTITNRRKAIKNMGVLVKNPNPSTIPRKKKFQNEISPRRIRKAKAIESNKNTSPVRSGVSLLTVIHFNVPHRKIEYPRSIHTHSANIKNEFVLFLV